MVQPADQPDHGGRIRRHPVVTGVLAVVALLLGALLVVTLTPLLDRRLASEPDVPASYEQAQARAAELTALDGPEVNPACRSEVLDHGQRTARSVVLLHGYTNCPEQFSVMARTYFDAGYNVVVLRIPEHGMADRMTRALSDLNPGDLVEAADDAVDVAAGLGERVSVVGLSAGGTMAAWAAAERDDVAEVGLLAPMMVPKLLPDFSVAPAARLSRFIPDIYVWWDPELKEQLASPPHAYPRYSLRSAGAMIALGRYAASSIDRTVPLERLVVVTNENDAAVSNSAIASMADELDDHAATRVDHVFPADLGYEHDVVDPQGENAADLEDIYETLGPLLGIPELAEHLRAHRAGA